MWRKGNPAGGNVNRCSHCGKWYGASFKKLKTSYYVVQQSHYWAYIQKRRKLIQKDPYIPVFIAALFIIAKIWKQPKCPSTDERRKKTWCIFSLSLSHTHVYAHTVEYYSAIRRIKWHLQQHGGTWRWSYWVKSPRQRKMNIIYRLYVESKNTVQMILFTTQKCTHRYRKQTYSYQRGRQKG